MKVVPENAVFGVHGLIFTNEGYENGIYWVGVHTDNGVVIHGKIQLIRARMLYSRHFEAAFADLR